MTNSLPHVVAHLAHEYDAAQDDIRRLAGHSEFSPKRLVSFERALSAAEHIVFLTDNGDWRTKARLAKAERDRALTAAGVHYGQLERNTNALEHAAALRNTGKGLPQDIQPPDVLGEAI